MPGVIDSRIPPSAMATTQVPLALASKGAYPNGSSLDP